MRLRPDRRTPHDPSPPPAQRTSAPGRPARARKALLAVLTTGLALAMSAVAAQPAQAVPGLQTRVDTSEANTDPVKNMTVVCPEGTVAIDGSVLQNAGRSVRITGIQIFERGVLATAAVEEGASAPNWFLHVIAKCAPRSSLPGLEYQRQASSGGSAASQSISAACSGGKGLIGMGGAILSANDSQRELMLESMRPNSARSRVLVSGHEDETGFSGSWRVLATAVCVDDPLAGAQVVSNGFSPVNSDDTKNVGTSCPPGTQIHGGGFDIASGGQTHLTSLISSPDDEARLTASEDRTGHSGRWRALVFAICAR